MSRRPNMTRMIARAAGLLRFFYTQRVRGFSVPDSPAFDPASQPFFVERLHEAGSYLEVGSGGSTVLAAKLGLPFVSVDSDRFFLDAVRRRIAEGDARGASKGTLIPVDIGLTEAWGAPVLRDPTPARVARWRAYPEAPWRALAGLPQPHLILVDGRFRVACALSAARFLAEGRKGLVLVDDYGDRVEPYAPIERYLTIERRVGRMIACTPKEGLDLEALARDIDAYCADWR